MDFFHQNNVAICQKEQANSSRIVLFEQNQVQLLNPVCHSRRHQDHKRETIPKW